MLVRGARPSGTSIVAAGGLGAAVKDDDQGRVGTEILRNIGPREQVARVRSETADLLQSQVRIDMQGVRQAAPQSAKASDGVVKPGNVRSPAAAIGLCTNTSGALLLQRNIKVVRRSRF